MTTSNQRKTKRKRLRLENERYWRSQSPLMLDIPTPGQKGKPKIAIPLKGKLKGKLRGERGILRESQFDQRTKVSIMMPGVKVRGKIGPAGERKLKTWLAKKAPDFVPLTSHEDIGRGRVLP